MYEVFITNIRALLVKSKVNPDDILAISIDGGTHIAVLLDQKQKVIRPAIYWSDGRSAEQAKRFTEEKERIAKISFNVPSPAWTLAQLQWIREEEPENFRKIASIRFLKDYIRYRLTGDFLTDSIEAMGSMLFDVSSDSWSDYLCSLCGLDSSVLPSIVSPGEIVGTIGEEAHQASGLSKRTKVVVGSTDTVMELLGAGAIGLGDTTIKLATAGRICVVSQNPVVSSLLVTYKHIVPGLWYPGSATKSCAASLRWFRDTFSCNKLDPAVYQKMDAMAQDIVPGADGLIFHPFLQGEITPYLDSSLRASFFGISSSHTYAHFCRSVMEGVAYSLKEGLDSLHSLNLQVKEPLKIIGGGSRSKLWSQIVSDVLGVSLLCVRTDDSAIGSAMHAGVASGVFSSYADVVSAVTKTTEEIHPNTENSQLYASSYELYRKIVAALQPLYQERQL
jgi:xylulokinase